MQEKILIVEDEVLVAKDLKAILGEAGYIVCGIARSVPQALEIIDREKPGMVLLDIYLKGTLTGIDLAEILNERNIAFVYLSANSNQSTIEAAKRTQPYGFMVKPFREEEVLVALEIAYYRHQNSLEAELNKERLLQDKLTKIRTLSAPFDQTFKAITEALQPFIPFDFIEFRRQGDRSTSPYWISFLRIGFNEYQQIGPSELLTIASLKAGELEKAQAVTPDEINMSFYNQDDFFSHLINYPRKKIYATTFDLHSSASLPMITGREDPFLISVYSKSKNAYNSKSIQFLSRMQQSLATTVSQLLSAPDAQKTREYGTDVTRGKAAVTASVPVFKGFVGKSQPILAALDFVKQVSAVDTSVLILGETGTGKEKIAEHIHMLSQRKDKPLIKINCAAIPSGLIESELFGHEKGAFTGAVCRRIGKFEQASGGTIFLDEIGDVPSDVQVKLLRVLQQREIERIGGRDTIKVDVRVVTATNKVLEKEVAEGRFRMDLYYRLNVFPIWIPPLRKRIEDIPLLVDHFIKLFSEKHGITVSGISASALEELMRYDWPGNIRELENSIERSIILATNGTIEQVFIQLTGIEKTSPQTQKEVKTIDEVEKEHIQIILTRCNNKVYGPGGAAEMLNIPPTTLMSKIKKLGINR
jgi:DNA-binding NtrC family response regulator